MKFREVREEVEEEPQADLNNVLAPADGVKVFNNGGAFLLNFRFII